MLRTFERPTRWRVLMLRTLERSDLAELSFSIQLEENGVLVKRVIF